MQRNRGQNNPLHSRNSLRYAQENSMSEELKNMVLQQKQMLMNISLGQSLMSSAAQHLQLPSQAMPAPLFPSLSNILPGSGVMPTLLSASSLNSPLVPHSFISGPSMVPPPEDGPSNFQLGSLSNRNSVFNASGKNIFASKNESQVHNSRNIKGSSKGRSTDLDDGKWTHSERFPVKATFDRSQNWARGREVNKGSNEKSWSSQVGEMSSGSKNVFANKSSTKDNDRWKPNVRDDDKLPQRFSEELRWSSKDRSDEQRWNDGDLENEKEFKFKDESRSKRPWEDERYRSKEEYRSFQEPREDSWNKKAKLSNENWNQTKDQGAWDKKSNVSKYNTQSTEPNKEWSSFKDSKDKQNWSNRSKESDENEWKMQSREQKWSKHDETSWSGRSPDSNDRHWKSNNSKTSDPLSYSSYEDTRYSKNIDFEKQRDQNKETYKSQDKKWSNSSNKEFDASVWAPKPKNESDLSWKKDAGWRSDERSGKSAQHQSWFRNEDEAQQGKSYDGDKTSSYKDSVRSVSTSKKISGEKLSETPKNFLYPDPDKQVKEVWSSLNNTEDTYNMAEDTRIEPKNQLNVFENEQILRSLQEKNETEQRLYMMMLKIKQQKEMEEKMGYLDSQLERLDERILQISGPPTESLLQKKIPDIWDFPVPLLNSIQESETIADSSNADLRMKLMSMRDSKSAMNSAKPATVDSTGGWGEDMVVVCPVSRLNKLTASDVSFLKEQLSEHIHGLLCNNSQDIQPRILGSKMVCDGWFLIHCGDASTLDWVLSWTPPVPVRSKYPVKIRKASDAARVSLISIFLRGIKENDFKKVNFRLVNQNLHADSRTWNRGPNPVVTPNGTEVNFLVDRYCLTLLEKNGWKVFYDLGCYKATLVDNKDIIPLKFAI